MLNQIYIHYITTLFVLESFIISCWLLKGKKIGIGIGIGQFAQKKSVSESATKNHDRASLPLAQLLQAGCHMIGKVVTGCILPYHTATQDRGSECRDFGFISRIVTALLVSH